MRIAISGSVLDLELRDLEFDSYQWDLSYLFIPYSFYLILSICIFSVHWKIIYKKISICEEVLSINKNTTEFDFKWWFSPFLVYKGDTWPIKARRKKRLKGTRSPTVRSISWPLCHRARMISTVSSSLSP